MSGAAVSVRMGPAFNEFIPMTHWLGCAAVCLSFLFFAANPVRGEVQAEAGTRLLVLKKHADDAPEIRAKRLALVIGNAAYRNGPLANPVNDARAIAVRLRSLGFEVIHKENLKTRELGGIYREFRNRIQPGGTSLVFYAGHGLQFKGQNYFPAVDSEIYSEEDVPLQSLNLGALLDNIEEAKAGVSLVLLDACRDNPFSRSFRSASRGLAKVETASGTLIHYATRPGSVASDGEGKNGTYTEALLAQMAEPGIPVEMMLKKVSNRVVEKTKGRQEPWIEGSLRGEFYFVAGGVGDIKIGVKPDENALWNSLNPLQPCEYQVYLDDFPTGRFAGLAKERLKGCRSGQGLQGMAAKEGKGELLSLAGNAKQGGYGKGRELPIIVDCPECPEMLVVPAGNFEMGASDGDPGEKPVRNVRIDYAFALSRSEITQRQWTAVMGTNPSNFASCGDDCPVENVSWADAQAFLRRLSLKSGRTYRLPSEAEWEYACRAGERHLYCGGENIETLSWYDGNSKKQIHPVARKEPNAWGFHDMSGNVWEWVSDCWNGNYIGAPTNGSEWTMHNCTVRRLRGGAWDSGPQFIRSSTRGSDNHLLRMHNNGVRPVRVLE